jgi:hypothetical protein
VSESRTGAAIAGIVAAMLAIAGCGGGGVKPGVASLTGSSNSAGHTTTTVAGKGDAAKLYRQWADCLRQHGINIADPSIDSQGAVNVSIPPSASMQTFQTADAACRSLQQAAQAAQNGGQPIQKPDPAKLLAFSKCMRAHGLTDFPDPSPGGGLQLSGGPGSNLRPDNPVFQAAQQACQSIVGMPKGGMRVTAGGPGPGGGGGGGGIVVGGGGK